MLRYIGRMEHVEKLELAPNKKYRVTVINANSFSIKIMVSDGAVICSKEYRNLEELMKSWCLS